MPVAGANPIPCDLESALVDVAGDFDDGGRGHLHAFRELREGDPAARVPDHRRAVPQQVGHPLAEASSLRGRHPREAAEALHAPAGSQEGVQHFVRLLCQRG